MKLTVTRDYLKRGLDAEGSKPFADATHQDMRTLVCAQCHSEYYFKATKWTDPDGKEQTAKVVTFRGMMAWPPKISKSITMTVTLLTGLTN